MINNELPNKQSLYRFLCVLLIILSSLLVVSPARAVSTRQDNDPFIQCKKGVELFSENKYAQALLFFEDSYKNRDSGYFENVSDLLMCAFLLGRTYQEQQEYDAALDVFSNTLDMSRAAKDKEFESTLLLHIGQIYEDKLLYADAMKYYQQSLVVAGQVDIPYLEIKARTSIGMLSIHQGLLPQARENLETALKLAESTNDEKETARILNILGAFYDELRDYTKSLNYYQKALEIREKLKDDKGIGIIFNNMGGVFYAQGQYQKALEYYEKSLAIRQALSDREGEARMYNQIGEVYKQQGQYAQAINYFNRALPLRKQERDYLGESITLQGLCDIYANLGQYANALENCEQGLTVVDGTNTKSEGQILNSIGVIYKRQQNYKTAKEYFLRSLKVFQLLNSEEQFTELNNLGTVYLLERDFEKALDYFQKVLEAGESGVTLNNIGYVYSEKGEYPKALEYFEKALTIRKKAGDMLGEAETLSHIGFVYFLQDDPLAAKYYEKAIDILEFVRGNSGNDIDKAKFISQYNSLYDLAIIVAIRDENAPEKAFLFSERGRARAFLDGMSTGYISLDDKEALLLYQKETDAYNLRQSAQDALDIAKTKKILDEKLIADLEIQLEQAKKNYQEVLNSISEHNSYIKQLIPGQSNILNVKQTQALLNEQTTLLSFWIVKDKIIVFVIKKNTFDVVLLPISYDNLYAKIKAFREFANDTVAYPESAVELYKALIEPLKTHLSTPNLVIVPHGELHYLPFAALTDGKRYLMDDYSITYLPSVSAWPYIKQNAGRVNANPLVIGNPATDQTGVKPLLSAESEAQAIANLYQTTVLLGKAATESAVRSQVGQAGILHLAAHGSYNTNNPLYSAIYLTPDGENDGLLETHEIYGLNLKKTDLVVLSACDTQLGELSTGDELVGLTRAFFFAGTPSVISSLWPVKDKATQLLMEKFYTYWRGGKSKAEALRQAQMNVRAEYPNPYYWAGFVLSGDGGEKTSIGLFQNSTPTNLWMFFGVFCCCLLFILIVVAVFWIILRRRK